jgi:hypothetical protein
MLAGPKTLEPLAKYGEAMQAALMRECPIASDQLGEDAPKWDQACNVGLIQNETKTVVSVDGAAMSLVEARRKGVEAFKAHPSVAAVPPAFQKLLATAAELRLTLGMVTINGVDGINLPRVSFALNYRLDDKALGLVANVDAEKYKRAIHDYFHAVAAERVGFSSAKPPKDADVEAAANAMVAALATYKDRYEAISGNETKDLPRLLADRPYVRLPVGIRFDVSDAGSAEGEERMAKFIDDEKRIRVESMSHQRALLAKQLFDALVKAADDNLHFGNARSRLFKEQAASYPLLSALALPNLEVGMDVGADVSSDFWHKRERFAKAGFQAVSQSARGDGVEPITAKMFDIDAMMASPR